MPKVLWLSPSSFDRLQISMDWLEPNHDALTLAKLPTVELA